MDDSRERQLQVLRIVCSVAWADGAVSDEEQRLLASLIARYFPSEDGSNALEEAAQQLTAWSVDASLLDEAMAQLVHDEDRILALKLAYMMARVSQRPGDCGPINAEEKQLYRRLVEGLDLSEAQVKEAEWAAEEELSRGPSLWTVLGSAFSGLGAWPSREMLETPGMQWL